MQKNEIRYRKENIHPLMKTALKTLRKYSKYIENSLKYKWSNGVIEGINRSIKVLKNLAYGYRSYFNFKNRILLRANLLTEK